MNYNNTHKSSGSMVSSTARPITVGDIRDAIAKLPDDTLVMLGACDCGCSVKITGFKDFGLEAICIVIGGQDDTDIA